MNKNRGLCLAVNDYGLKNDDTNDTSSASRVDRGESDQFLFEDLRGLDKIVKM